MIRWGLKLPLEIQGEKDTLWLLISQREVFHLTCLCRKREERYSHSSAAALTSSSFSSDLSRTGLLKEAGEEEESELREEPLGGKGERRREEALVVDRTQRIASWICKNKMNQGCQFNLGHGMQLTYN